MNGKIENDPSVLICVKSARTFRVHFNFIALNFFFCDSKSNKREGLETRDFFLALGSVHWKPVGGGLFMIFGD